MVVFNHNILTSFSDLSRFYSIGNTNIALSRDQAISIAQKEAFNSNILNITSEKGTSKQVTLDLPTQPQSVQLNAFCRQPLTYSPMWQIQFYASEPVYGTNGYQIGIWADTGQIQYSHLTSIHGVTDNPDNTDSTNFISQTPNTTDNSQPLANPFIILFIFAGVAVTIMLAFTLLLNKRRQNK
jgi:hypothetical protein